ncbi:MULTISPECIES: 4-alpha-glucanotransferase [unclassified Shewanella]|uniref:4-alpha-glucanotransferase n=1 Tax=unclassified Shewanella TaxID=196818 RepID=UPI001BC30578|nr:MULTISPECIES: 4-alpha-glucanotransferase [unclassified Shewanella]GIU09229.1 4-alpha-glucanotransferase [Shewanella sp. MBTL60-112-B1]
MLSKLLYLQGVGAEFINSDGVNVQIPQQDRNGVLQAMLTQTAPDLSFDACHSQQNDAYNATNTWIDKRIYQLDADPWTQPVAHFQHSNNVEPKISFQVPADYSGCVEIELQLESGSYCKIEFLAAENPFVRVTGNYGIGDQTYLRYELSLTAEVVELICSGTILNLDNQTQHLQRLPAAQYFTVKQALTKSNGLNTSNGLTLGYHQVCVNLPTIDIKADGIWLLAPEVSYQGAGLTDNVAKEVKKRCWGVSLQLYSLQSQQQWGIGDFADLQALLKIVASKGADFVLLNPLHALDLEHPEEASPYSPSDRRRINPLYIDVESLPEYQLWQLSLTAIEREQVQLDKQQLQQTNWLNYPEITRIKYRLLQRLYEIFCQQALIHESQAVEELESFIAAQEPDFSLFCRKQLHAASQMFAKEPIGLALDERFFAYLQFIAQQQLQACQLLAKQLGMEIGLVRDLAVGTNASSIEVESAKELFCRDAYIGAPADFFAPQGQNWGLAPMDPIALEQTGFKHFIKLLRTNMRSCGALRIDHVMSLLRLWWLPKDKALGNGAYVYYPLDSLMAILSIESHRAQCLVIGEDLGLVPAEIEQAINRSKILSNQVFYFTKQLGKFVATSEHKPHSLMMLANHDVPTLKSWWQADDLHLRKELLLIETDEALSNALQQRAYEKHQLIEWLYEAGGLSIDELQNHKKQELRFDCLLTAWLEVAASSASKLFSVQLCDLMQDHHSINLPGTWKQYPNWRRRLPLPLEELESSAAIDALLKRVDRARQAKQSANLSPVNQSSGHASDISSAVAR